MKPSTSTVVLAAAVMWLGCTPQPAPHPAPRARGDQAVGDVSPPAVTSETHTPSAPANPTASTVESCRDSAGCKQSGLCDDGPSGCEAASSEPCMASYQCKLLGQCSAVNGKCVVASDADCRVLGHCSQGNCFAFEGSCRTRHACSCDYSTGPVPPPAVLEANQARARECLKAAGGSLPGACPPKQ